MAIKRDAETLKYAMELLKDPTLSNLQRQEKLGKYGDDSPHPAIPPPTSEKNDCNTSDDSDDEESSEGESNLDDLDFNSIPNFAPSHNTPNNTTPPVHSLETLFNSANQKPWMQRLKEQGYGIHELRLSNNDRVHYQSDDDMEDNFPDVDLLPSPSSARPTGKAQRNKNVSSPQPKHRGKRSKTTRIDWNKHYHMTNIMTLYNNSHNHDEVVYTVVASSTIQEKDSHTFHNLTEVTDGDNKITAKIILPEGFDRSEAEQWLPQRTVISIEPGDYVVVSETSHDPPHYVTAAKIMVLKFKRLDKIPKEDWPYDNHFTTAQAQADKDRTLALLHKPTDDVVMDRCDCKGVVCGKAALEAVSSNSAATTAASINISECLARRELPTLQYVARANPLYDGKYGDEVDSMASHYKRQCYYYYFAKSLLKAGGRIPLPFCIRNKIHMLYPCDDEEYCDRRQGEDNCPTCDRDTFRDGYGFPKQSVKKD